MPIAAAVKVEEALSEELLGSYLGRPISDNPDKPVEDNRLVGRLQSER
jgi:hypothetical protein